jgi:hypothetical protein
VTKKIDGQLEIDSDRGVIYFHSKAGFTVLRICSLPKPIPEPNRAQVLLDVTHMYGTSWDKGESLMKSFENMMSREYGVTCVDVTSEVSAESKREPGEGGTQPPTEPGSG